MIDLSIIIPHYNSVMQLKKLLTTIPNQDNIQVIVIDDKSNKDIGELECLRNNHKYNHVLFLDNETEKKGAGVCRNIGLEHMVGKWILFADADDFFMPEFYENVKEYFNSKYDVVFFTPTSSEIDTGKPSNRHLNYEKLINDYQNSKDLKSEVNLRYKFYVPWSKLISKDLIKRNNLVFDEVIASNDVMFSTKIGYLMENFKVTSDVIYCVTKGFSTLTTNTSPIVAESRVVVFINYYIFLKKELSINEFKLLQLHGLGGLVNVIKSGLGFKRTILFYFELKKNKVKILLPRFFNPVFFVRKTVKYFVKH